MGADFNPSDKTVGNLGHFCCGWAVLLTLVVVGHSARVLWPWGLAAVGLALAKEFVWDIFMESGEVSGMWWGGVEDFAGYFSGAVFALLILKFAGWL